MRTDNIAHALSLIIAQEQQDSQVEINVGNKLWAVAFSANGEYLLSGNDSGVQVWRVVDGEHLATIKARRVLCLAVSRDGRWIAARTWRDDMFVWDAVTHEKVLSQWEDHHIINGVDFSPDSARLVSASFAGTATIWDLATRKQIQILRHRHWMMAAKYSPRGDRIATATPNSVRVWDSSDGRLLVDVSVTVTPFFNTGLLWFNNYLFVVSNNKIKQLEASTGSPVSEWPVPDSNSYSCIALPKHGEFIAYSTQRTITFWHTATHTQLAFIQHTRDILSIAVSPGDQFLAILGGDGKITIKSLSCITVSTMSR